MEISSLLGVAAYDSVWVDSLEGLAGSAGSASLHAEDRHTGIGLSETFGSYPLNRNHGHKARGRMTDGTQVATQQKEQ
jgi:hypothetical protein